MGRGLTIVIIGVAIVALWGHMTATAAGSLASISDHARLMRPITAIITFADGSTEIRQGQGFVIGNRLFTVYHTLGPRLKNTSLVKREIYVAGRLMTPVYTHAAHDIAIFELPNALCKPDCGALTASRSTALNPDRQVYWVQEAAGEPLVVAHT